MKFRDHPRLPGIEFEPSSKPQITKEEKLLALRPPPKPASILNHTKKSFANLAPDVFRGFAVDVFVKLIWLLIGLIASGIDYALWHYDPMGWRENHPLGDKRPATIQPQSWSTKTIKNGAE
jgi:hypothetical protein